MLMTRKKEIESMPLLIEYVSNNITGIIFHGVVLVTYLNLLEKQNNTKAILYTNLTDKKVEMTITLLVPTQVIEQNEAKLITNVGVFIRNFEIILKHKYNSDYCEKTISLNSFSIVENICFVCIKY